MAMLMEKLHDIRATALRSNADQLPMSAKTVIPTGNHPAELEMWIFTLYESVTKCALEKILRSPGACYVSTNLHALNLHLSRVDCRYSVAKSRFNDFT